MKFQFFSKIGNFLDKLELFWNIDLKNEKDKKRRQQYEKFIDWSSRVIQSCKNPEQLDVARQFILNQIENRVLNGKIAAEDANIVYEIVHYNYRTKLAHLPEINS